MAMNKRKIDKGVILAAGDGDRLGSLTSTYPKVLLPVDDKALLISYPIEAMVSSGINEIAIVVGYLGDKVIEVLGDGSNFGAKLQYIFNPDYLGGNAISVHKARDWVQEDPVVLCMGDHIIEKKAVKRLLDRQTVNETLCVDYTPAQHHQLAEATKVTIDIAGCITEIGKDLVHWNALDTGTFLLTENFFRALEELVHKLGNNVEMSDAIRCFWTDVDTSEDLDRVRA